MAQMNHEQFEAIKGVGDVTAVAVTIGTLASILPPLAALATLIWTAIRIFETKTVQAILDRFRSKAAD